MRRAGMGTNQVLGALALLVLAGLHILSNWLPYRVLIPLALFVALVQGTAKGRSLLSMASGRATSLLGRYVSDAQVLAVLVLVLALAGRGLLGGVAGAASAGRRSAGRGSTASDVVEAYAAGYKAGKKGLDYDPPDYVPPDLDDYSSSGGGGGGGFGIGSLLRYGETPRSRAPAPACRADEGWWLAGLVGNMIYRMGGGGGPTGWSPQTLVASARANPMQAFFGVMMLSNVLF